MLNYKYLVIGGGMTADAAITAIRHADPKGTIGLVSAEWVSPYDRPPLSKGLWKNDSLESIWRKTEDKNVEIHLGTTILFLDPQTKRATDNYEQTYTYEKLLLAVGGTPKKFSFGGEHIIYYRTLEDYQRLLTLCEKRNRFAVIGSGFIGAEIAAALSMNDKQVSMIFSAKAIGANMFPSDLALFLNDYYRKKGVELYPQQIATGFRMEDGFPTILTESEQAFSADAIIAGTGIQPNLELAEMAGLKIKNGIVVDEFLQTSHPDIYAAGDVASFYSAALGQYIRPEHEDNAKKMGQCAGRNMAGDPAPYDRIPYFYSDLFDLSYEAVGELNSRFETVADWKEPYEEGIVYYLKDERVRGVLFWNVSGKLDAARQLIAEPGPFRAEDLKGRFHFFSKSNPLAKVLSQ